MLSKVSGTVSARFTNLSVWLMGLVCSVTILIDLRRGWEGTWFYTISTIMHRPTEAPAVFSRRILFPYLAVMLQRGFPSLSDHNCFIATQIGAILLAVYLSGEWASLFLPRVGKLAGYALVTLMLCPLLTYWNFYDIWILGFWTGCLLLLRRDHRFGFLALFAIATLNHENILLIVPCALLYNWGRMKTLNLILFITAQVAIWSAMRFFVFSIIRANGAFEIFFWNNLHFWRNYSPQGLFFAVATLVPWWLLASTGWKYAPRLLRCSVITLPFLAVETLIFGRLEEGRLFIAFIPTCIGLVCCRLATVINEPTNCDQFDPAAGA